MTLFHSRSQSVPPPTRPIALPRGRGVVCLLTMTAWLVSISAALAQPPASCAETADQRLAACAPDQSLALDAAPPSRRFASYSNVVALVRGAVSVGLVLVPCPRGPLSRVRVDVGAVTRLRSPRGVTVVGRVGVGLVGQGLDALFLAATVSYALREQARSTARVGAELGYAHHFQGLFLGASVGAEVTLLAGVGEPRVRPTVRLVVGHAFY